MNREQIIAIYERSQTYLLAPDIEEHITGSTLDARALKFLGTLIETANPNPLYWMEFGSGLSTFFTARLLSRNPRAHIYSVDHSDHYMAQTQDACREYNNVTYIHAPISPYRYKLMSFLTYNNGYVAKIPDGIKFDIVLIDGPLGFRYGREAPLYQIAAHLKPETIIVLDDAGREPEQRAMANWQRVWSDGLEVEYFSGHKGLAAIQIHKPSNITSYPFHPSEIWQSWQGIQERLKAEGGKTSSLVPFVSFSLSMWNKARGKFRRLRAKIRG